MPTTKPPLSVSRKPVVRGECLEIAIKSEGRAEVILFPVECLDDMAAYLGETEPNGDATLAVKLFDNHRPALLTIAAKALDEGSSRADGCVVVHRRYFQAAGLTP